MRTICLLLLLAALPVAAQTNHPPVCCRYPLRAMGPGLVVNLSPLFHWWTSPDATNQDLSAGTTNNAAPPRPLSAWKRITGTKTAELDDAWVVDADIHTSPNTLTNEYIVLLHPPAAEEQQYYNLQSLLAQYNDQITHDANVQQADEKAEKKVDDNANQQASSYSKSVRAYAPDYSQQAALDRHAAAIAAKDKKTAEQERDQVQQQLAALPGFNGQYQLDFFALDLGRNRKGQHVFDAGEVDPAAP